MAIRPTPHVVVCRSDVIGQGDCCQLVIGQCVLFSRGLDQLWAPGGWIDRNMTLGHEGMFDLIRRG